MARAADRARRSQTQSLSDLVQACGPEIGTAVSTVSAVNSSSSRRSIQASLRRGSVVEASGSAAFANSTASRRRASQAASFGPRSSSSGSFVQAGRRESSARRRQSAPQDGVGCSRCSLLNDKIRRLEEELVQEDLAQAEAEAKGKRAIESQDEYRKTMKQNSAELRDLRAELAETTRQLRSQKERLDVAEALSEAKQAELQDLRRRLWTPEDATDKEEVGHNEELAKLEATCIASEAACAVELVTARRLAEVAALLFDGKDSAVMEACARVLGITDRSMEMSGA